MNLREVKCVVESLSADELKAFSHWFDGYLTGRSPEDLSRNAVPAPISHRKIADENQSRRESTRKQRIFKHISGVTSKADIEGIGNERFRYSLVATHSEVQRRTETACVVMLNPSYADERLADQTVHRLEKVVFQQNLPEFSLVGRLVIVNLFARIQTTDFTGADEDVGPRNDSVLKHWLHECDIAVIGWGNTCRHTERQDFVYNVLQQSPGKRLFRTTKHPSRASYTNFMSPFKLGS